MKEKPPLSYTKALDASYRFISYRERSTKEVEDRLKRRGFDDETRGKVIAFLKAKRLLDDDRFAKAYVNAMLKRSPSGLDLLKMKLSGKGVPSDISESVISGIGKDYDEYESAYKAASSRLKKYAGISEEKAKRRIYEYLMRRRFKRSVVFTILRDIFKNRQAQENESE